MLGSSLLLLISLFFILKQSSKGLLVVVVISLTNDLFKIPLNINIAIHHLIGLFYLPIILLYYFNQKRNIRSYISPILWEIYYLIFLAFLFGFIFPWRSEYDYLRGWSQKSEGRAIIQIIRLFGDISILLLVYYWLATKKVSFEYLVKVFEIIISFTVAVAILNFLSSNTLKYVFFPETFGEFKGRFSGFSMEPRNMGRVCSLAALFLLSFGKITGKSINIGLILAFIGVLVSFSASTYILTMVWGGFFLFFTGRLSYILIAITVLMFSFLLIRQNEFFQEQTLNKILAVISISGGNQAAFYEEKVDSVEPDLFKRFEVFDRAALNFLYRHPAYWVTGTGPNLISIPASPYLTETTKSIYGVNIDSVPHSFIINLVSRSGVIGFILWIVTFFKFKYSLCNSNANKRVFFYGLIVSQLLVASILFYFFLGILLFFINNKAKI